MSEQNDHRNVIERDQKRVRLQERWVFVGLAVVFVATAAVLYSLIFGPTHKAIWDYEPQEGDIIFHSAPGSPLVMAIEEATASPYSHCGLVAEGENGWEVLEAFRKVQRTKLDEFIHRGRGGGFAVYRLRPEYRGCVKPMVEYANGLLGRWEDERMQMDDERIYAAELIYKAYASASEGESLGELVPLGDLHWRPHRKTFLRIEGGTLPLERQLITPKHLSRAKQLERVYTFRLEQDHY